MQDQLFVHTMHSPYVHFSQSILDEYMFLHLPWILLASSNAASLNQWLVSSEQEASSPLTLTARPWDFINIISSSGAADMEQRAAINNSSLVLAPCLGIHTTRSLLCRFGAVHDPNTSLLLWECVCVSSSVKVCVCVCVCVIVVLWVCVCVCV